MNPPLSPSTSPPRRVPDAARGASATEELVLAHLPDIVTLCNRMFRHRADAQDAVNEAVVAVLTSYPQYRGDGPVRHWLLKVALNAARKHRHRLKRTTGRETTLEEGIVSRAAPTPDVEERERAEALRRAIVELAAPLREAVVLHYFHRLTQAQVGAVAGCSQKTVHVRLRKGLAQLERRLRGHGAFAALPLTSVLGAGAIDAVTAQQVAQVKQCIAAHAAGAAATTAGTALATAAVATGGAVMNAKLVAGAVVIAVASFLGGAALSDPIFGADDRPGSPTAAVDEDRSVGPDTSAGAIAEGTSDADTRRSLEREIARLRSALRDRDSVIRELEDRDEVEIEEEEETEEQKRNGRWNRIREAMGSFASTFNEMEEAGERQAPLAPEIVEHLRAIPTDTYREMVAYHDHAKRPGRRDPLRRFLVQALLHAPSAAPVRDAFLGRVLERIEAQEYDDVFNEKALHRLTLHVSDELDQYDRLLAPSSDDVRRRYLEFALRRIRLDANEQHQLDGARFLARSDHPLAPQELRTEFQRTTHPYDVRRALLSGLERHAATDPAVLALLRDAIDVEDHQLIRNRLVEIVEGIETSRGDGK